MKAIGLPSSESLMMPGPNSMNVLLRVPQEEIDHVNDLLVSIRRKGRQILKEAIEVGEFFVKARKVFRGEVRWQKWTRTNFPTVHLSTIYRYEKLALNRDFITAMTCDESVPSVTEAWRMISKKDKMAKPRVRAVVVNTEASPEVQLEAKLKNYVIELWRLRYLQTEIEGLIEAMQLKPEQVLRVLRYVCKEHHEVEDEVLHTFNPGPKVVSRGA